MCRRTAVLLSFLTGLFLPVLLLIWLTEGELTTAIGTPGEDLYTTPVWMALLPLSLGVLWGLQSRSFYSVAACTGNVGASLCVLLSYPRGFWPPLILCLWGLGQLKLIEQYDESEYDQKRPITAAFAYISDSGVDVWKYGIQLLKLRPLRWAEEGIGSLIRHAGPLMLLRPEVRTRYAPFLGRPQRSAVSFALVTDLVSCAAVPSLIFVDYLKIMGGVGYGLSVSILVPIIALRLATAAVLASTYRGRVRVLVSLPFEIAAWFMLGKLPYLIPFYSLLAGRLARFQRK